MAAIHPVDPAKLAGVVVARDFRATVARWRDIYEDVRLVPDPVVEEAYAWLLDNEPDAGRRRASSTATTGSATAWSTAAG